MSLPIATTTYKIKNYATGAYIGYDGSNPNRIQRSAPASDIGSDWVFIPTAGGYHLQNVASKLFCNGYLTSYAANYYFTPYMQVALGLPVIVTINGNKRINIRVRPTASDNAAYYLCGSTPSSDTVLWAYALYDASHNSVTVSDLEWVLEPASSSVSPMINKNPLPKGLYRIRSFTSEYVLTMPETTSTTGGDVLPYVTEPSPSNSYQKWLVTPQENGLYTISNSDNNLYLAAPSQNVAPGSNIVGRAVKDGTTPFQWNIQTYGPGIFFFVGVPTEALALGFSDYEADDLEHVALTIADNDASQIWLFETVRQPFMGTYHEMRLLQPGKYVIEVAYDNAFLSTTTSDDLTEEDTISQATKFTVAYNKADGGRFTLSFTDSNAGKSYIVASPLGGGRLETTDVKSSSTEWIVLPLSRRNDAGTAYHICQADTDQPRKAISSRQIKDRSKYYFAVDPLAKQETMQMFRFRAVD